MKKPSSAEKRSEKLKDRQAYRETLIHRRNETDAKIEQTEKQIRELKAVQA